MVKDGSKTTELKVAVGSIISVLILVMVVTGAISQSEADSLSGVLITAVSTLILSVPVVIGWISTTYTNARRDVKTSADTVVITNNQHSDSEAGDAIAMARAMGKS